MWVVLYCAFVCHVFLSVFLMVEKPTDLIPVNGPHEDGFGLCCIIISTITPHVEREKAMLTNVAKMLTKDLMRSLFI